MPINIKYCPIELSSRKLPALFFAIIITIIIMIIMIIMIVIMMMIIEEKRNGEREKELYKINDNDNDAVHNDHNDEVC